LIQVSPDTVAGLTSRTKSQYTGNELTNATSFDRMPCTIRMMIRSCTGHKTFQQL